SCDLLSSVCRMVPTSIFCFLPTRRSSDLRVPRSRIAQQVHGCTTAVICCCRSCEVWSSCTIYRSVSTCLTDRRRMSVNSCDHLCSCCRMVTTSICCIPSASKDSQAGCTCCCIAQQVHGCTTAVIGCCRNCEVWSSCTIYRSVSTCLTDSRRMSVNGCDHLCPDCRMVTTSICCIPSASEDSQAGCTCCC